MEEGIDRRVVIAGAGLAGLCAAAALYKVHLYPAH